MSATMPKICRHPDGTDNCDCGGLTGEVCRWVKIIADEQADWDRREKVEYLTAERIRLKRRIGELEEQLRAAQPAPIAGLEPVAWQLRYAGSNHPWVNAEKVNTGSDIEWRGLVPVAQAEAHAAEQVRAERERIAAWHDEQARNFRLADTEHDNIEAFAHELSAAAIRARGQV